MLKKVIILTLSMMLALAFAVGCSNPAEEENGYDNGETTTQDVAVDNPVQTFIDENRGDLEAASAPLLATMGDGATVDFEAGIDEFIYVYTYGDFPSEGLIEILEVVLDTSAGVYELLATEMGNEMGIDDLVVTVRYYDADGDFLIAESFSGR
ncbi:MAG: DUF4854 domain-containing protein [Coriobacteriia bacterium]|nr:DUF4854 domain-containing protein [Coriobacteriia bacterium]